MPHVTLVSVSHLPITTAASSRAAIEARVAATDTLKGTVVDSAGTPVGDVIVSLVELKRGTTTGRDGRFVLLGVPRGRQTLAVRRVGYAPISQQLLVSGTTTLKLTLGATALRLEAVTITATRAPISPLASPLPTDALSGERLRREQEVSLSQALDGFAGVRNLSTGQQVGKPVIRGLTGPRVLILDDGLRLEDYSWSDEDGPSVDSRLAERIEVIRGPASVLYGSDAIGGVINVVPEDVPDVRGEKPFVEGAAEAYGATNNDEIGGLLRAQGGRGSIGFRATAIGRHAGNFHTPRGNEQTPTGDIFDTGYGSLNGELAVGYRGDKNGATLRYERYGGNFGLLDGPPVEEDNQSGPLRRLADDRIQGATTWQLGEHARLETKSQYQRHSLKELVGDSRTGDDMPSFDLLLQTFTTDLLLHHDHADWLTGTIGVSGLYQDNKSSGVFPLVPDARTSNVAAFAFEQATKGQWSFLAGVRGDAHRITADANTDLQLDAQTRSTSAFTGDVGAVYRPIEHLALAANLGRAFRAPTLFELFTNGPHLGEGRYEVGLASAKPEASLNTDVSVRWESPKFRGEIAAYRNRIDHYLYVEPTGGIATVENDAGGEDTLPVYQFKQTSQATLTGVDISTEIEAASMLTLRGRFDYVRGNNEATDSPLPLMPPARGDLEAELHTAGAEHNRAYVMAGTQIVSRQKRLGQFDTPTGGYTLFNLGAGAGRQFGGREFYLDLRLRNLTNKRYNDFLSRYKTFAYEPGRNLIVRVSTGL
ncbi:MAG: TonB-dependent receptor [Gemmatimonadota bacterium]|nr:TonB-dependent receptor [Gemmatimonadota bacterium]